MERELFFTSLNVVIQSPKRITVLSHVNPDGDAIGSALGFSQFLRKFGHEVEVMVPNAFPDFLAWLPGADQMSNATLRTGLDTTFEILDVSDPQYDASNRTYSFVC